MNQPEKTDRFVDFVVKSSKLNFNFLYRAEDPLGAVEEHLDFMLYWESDTRYNDIVQVIEANRPVSHHSAFRVSFDVSSDIPKPKIKDLNERHNQSPPFDSP